VGVRKPGNLHERAALILLDNLEHLLPVAPQLSELLEQSPRMQFLVTSRAPLRIAAEREYPLAPFTDDEAMTFLVERARAVGRTIAADETALAICRRLDRLHWPSSLPRPVCGC
jgi:predicted ATPase